MKLRDMQFFFDTAWERSGRARLQPCHQSPPILGISPWVRSCGHTARNR